MGFRVFANGQPFDANPVNENFYHFRRGTVLPRSGSALIATTKTYNLGSASFRWNNLHISAVYPIADTGTYPTATSGPQLKISNQSYLKDDSGEGSGGYNVISGEQYKTKIIVESVSSSFIGNTATVIAHGITNASSRVVGVQQSWNETTTSNVRNDPAHGTVFEFTDSNMIVYRQIGTVGTYYYRVEYKA